MKLRKKHILVFLLGLFNVLSAQNFEWLKSYGNKNSESIIGLGVEGYQLAVEWFVNKGA